MTKDKSLLSLSISEDAYARRVTEEIKAKVPRHFDALSHKGSLPPLKVSMHQATATMDLVEVRGKIEPEDTTEAGKAALRKARAEAKAKSSSCWEDIISFLEMNKLSGAYALAFSAYGIEDLSKLLSLEDEELGHLLDKCNIDAMDEILLLEALRAARVR